MKIVYRKPLFWNIVTWFYSNAVWGKVIFTFGDTIYAPHLLDKAIETHEMVHIKQHHSSKLFACYVFLRCYFDKKYFLKIETEAYQAENKIVYAPEKYARNISSSVYNNIISYKDALKLFI
jgi:hypothetical protein